LIRIIFADLATSQHYGMDAEGSERPELSLRELGFVCIYPIPDPNSRERTSQCRFGRVDGGKAESVWLSDQVGRPVVTALNAVRAVTLANRGRPGGAFGRIAIPAAG